MKQLTQLLTLEGSENTIYSNSENNQSNEHFQTLNKKQRINRNRIIRKNKLELRGKDDILKFDRQQRKQLTKDQKHQIQKIKNRESAQKCRDQKKIYIQNLEKQINKLVEQNKKLMNLLDTQGKICKICESKLIEETTQSNAHNQIEQFVYQQLPNQIIEQSYYTRMNNQGDEPINFLPYIMIILVISLGIFTSISIPPETPPTELFKIEAISFQKIQIKSPKQLANNQKFELVPVQPPSRNEIEIFTGVYQHSLGNYLSLTSQNCMKNFINHHQKIDILNKNNNLRSKQRKIKNRTDILFCDTPRIFKQSQQQNFITPSLEIILNGNELRQIILKGDGIYLDPFPYIGLYTLKVQIKEIRKYNDLQCLT